MAFNPKTPGPMKVVADMQDVNYYMLRATECIGQAVTPSTNCMKCSQLTMAIQLLVLAKIRLDESLELK